MNKLSLAWSLYSSVRSPSWPINNMQGELDHVETTPKPLEISISRSRLNISILNRSEYYDSSIWAQQAHRQWYQPPSPWGDALLLTASPRDALVHLLRRLRGPLSSIPCQPLFQVQQELPYWPFAQHTHRGEPWPASCCAAGPWRQDRKP